MAYNSPHYQGDPSTIHKDKDGNEYLVPAKALNIVWGRDDRYWKLPKDSGVPAELLQVSWLEVVGSVDETDPRKNYEVGFTLSLKGDAFGWNKYPIYLMMKRGKEGEAVWKKFILKTSSNNANGGQTFEIFGKLMKSNSNDAKVFFGLYEVWSGKWKGGLLIHHAFVRETEP